VSFSAPSGGPDFEGGGVHDQSYVRQDEEQPCNYFIAFTIFALFFLSIGVFFCVANHYIFVLQITAYMCCKWCCESLLHKFFKLVSSSCSSSIRDWYWGRWPKFFPTRARTTSPRPSSISMYAYFFFFFLLQPYTYQVVNNYVPVMQLAS
jgi:hypothetical protein